jgi:hypothetical protein
VAKIGALKMLMLNMEQTAMDSAAPPPSTCDNGASSSTRQLIGSIHSGIDSSNSQILLHECESRNASLHNTSARRVQEVKSTASGSITFTKAARPGNEPSFPLASTKGLEASTGCTGTDLAAIAQAVSQVLLEQRATSAAIEEIRAGFLSSCAGSTTAPVTRTKVRAAGDDEYLLCRTRLTPAAHGRRIQMRWRQERCVERVHVHSLTAKIPGELDVSGEQSPSNLQSFKTVPPQCSQDSACNKISYESTSDTNCNIPGDLWSSIMPVIVLFVHVHMLNPSSEYILWMGFADVKFSPSPIPSMQKVLETAGSVPNITEQNISEYGSCTLSPGVQVIEKTIYIYIVFATNAFYDTLL